MTNQPARFCEQCGKALNPTARFCGSCGHTVADIGDTQPVRRAGPPQAPQPAPSAPTVLAPRTQPAAPPTSQASPSAPTVLAPRAQPAAPQLAPLQPAQAAPRPLPVHPQYLPPAPQPQPAPYQPVSPAPMPAAPAPQAPTEPVFGVIPGARRKKGFLGMGMDQFILVVTPFRIIFATQTNKMVQDEYLHAKEAAKQQGKGFLGQWGAMLTTNAGQKYLNMPLGAIMGEHPNNFFIANNQIRSVKVHSNYDEESGRSEYNIVIDAVTGKIKLSFGALDEKSARNLLRQTLGGVVK